MCYMHNLESVLENKKYKIPWGFQIQTDHFILARLPELAIVIKKENLPNIRLTDYSVNRKEGDRKK